MEVIPSVITGKTASWACSTWNLDGLSHVVKEKLVFRIGKKSSSDVQFESECDYIEASISDFYKWTQDEKNREDTGKPQENFPFANYNKEDYWAYADYKYMKDLFSNEPSLFNVVDWGTVGLSNRNGKESTFWLGSIGAYTVCHYDTYGCNLVAQIYGRKKWVLFPPDQACFMYPTRIPYEESSVFSQVNVKNPDHKKHPKFMNSTPYVIVLNPGDILYVPRHWWHYVECLDTAISINTWIEIDEDIDERIKEALTRNIVCALMQESSNKWLNPTEEEFSPADNMSLLNAALKQWNQKCTSASTSAVSSEIEQAGDKSNVSIKNFYDHIIKTKTPVAQCQKFTCEEYIWQHLGKTNSMTGNMVESEQVESTCKKLKLDMYKDNVSLPNSTKNDPLDTEKNSPLDLSLCDVLNCIVSKEAIGTICEKVKECYSSKYNFP